jgi:hypothetical protein
MSEHPGVTGKTPHQVARPCRASGLGQEAPSQHTPSGKLRDVIRSMLTKKATKQIIEKVLVSAASMAVIAVGLAAPASAAVQKHPSPQGFLAAVQGQASPDWDRGYWKTVTTCAGSFGISTARLIRWLRVCRRTIRH